MKELKVVLKERIVKMGDFFKEKISSQANWLNKLLEKTSKLVKVFINIILGDFKGTDESLKEIDKNDPLFVIVRLFYFYLFAGISIASYSILVAIPKNVPFSAISTFFSSMIFLIPVFLVFGIGAARIFLKTGEKHQDTKEIANFLNESMAPIITFIIIMSLTPLENSSTQEVLKEIYFLEMRDVFLRVMPLFITIIYNAKVFWFKMNDLNQKNQTTK